MSIKSRRNFLKTAGGIAGGTMITSLVNASCLYKANVSNAVPLYGHLWVYASRYPPHWDCTPILDEVFSDLKYAGLQGVELMEVLLRPDDAVTRLNDLIHTYSLPVIGTSYNADMWNRNKQQQILEDVDLVTERLQAVGGNMLGITVGDARHKKTEEELDAQAEL
ncbi:MAG: hypothetical protein JWQ09_380, partial [Segetibacter sp.]|nr:hypothetical protein [Segetibacter sp.]